MNIRWLEWPAPANVKACYTLRHGGNSQEPYNSFNMGDHVGDASSLVTANRQQLATSISLTTITWLNQVHGTRAIELPLQESSPIDADASFTCAMHQACSIMTADCLPVFFCNGIHSEGATQVAMAHAGWRGLLQGVLQNTLSSFQSSSSVIAYLGPAISQRAFEVGDEVCQAFLEQKPELKHCFIPSANHTKWMADLYGIARVLLIESGVAAVYGGDRCTYTEKDDFFSYRRDGVTGRMANLIWLQSR